MKNNRENCPFVTLNIAMTVDNKTDTVVRTGAAISSEIDFLRVDHLRVHHDAIMDGSIHC